MSPNRSLIETLEDRRLLSVTVTTIVGTSAVAGTPSGDIVRGQKATLSAQTSATTGDKVSSVTYFIDRNNNGTFDKGTDVLLGKSSSSKNNFAITKTIPTSTTLGDITVSAVATGKGKNNVSPAATQIFTIIDDNPTIKKLTASPSKVAAAGKLTITASSVKDSDGSVTGVELFVDTNHDGQIDQGDTDLGAATQQGKSGNWKFDASSLVATATSGQSFTILAQATDNDASTSSATSPVSTTVTVK
jgi:hypothetical protein